MSKTESDSHILFFLKLLTVAVPMLAAVWLVRETTDVLRADFDQWSDLRYILVQETENERLNAALEDFVDVADRRGISLHKIHDEEWPRSRSLRLELVPERLDLYDGYILSRAGGGVSLQAATEVGLANGLYGILRESFGARWYWSGEIGFELVGEILGDLPVESIEEIPAFVQRTFYPVASEFGRRNRLVRKYAFNHNLARVFDSDLFERFPEVFAVYQGMRRRPRGNGTTDWNPDLTSEETVRISVEAVREHFDQNPDSTSFSLSMNDNMRFDDGPETQAIVAPIEYFRGRPNYTDLIFSYMNEVAEELFSDSSYLQTPSGEDRYLTALAYYWAEQSPSFKIHPRVMPVLTSDRGQWHDPDYRKEDRALIERWSESGAERIATWDYYFGSPYPYPRQFTRWIAESIPFLHQNGVDVFYSQLRSIWGLDGPKGWLASELLWDPYQDSDALLDEFYSEFFGAGGESIRAFYEAAESRRNEAEGEANWIKHYNNEAGIEIFDVATLGRMRNLLDEAKAEVPAGSRFAKRIQAVSEAFSYTEAYHAYHFARRDLFDLSTKAFMDPNSLELPELLAARDRWAESKDAYHDVRLLLRDQDLHKRLRTFERILQSDPYPMFLAAIAAMKKIDDAGLDLEEQDGAREVEKWLGGEFKWRPLLRNSEFAYGGTELKDFLGPEVPDVKGWGMRYRASEGLAFIDQSGRAGSGLQIRGVDYVLYEQAISVESGQRYLVELDAAWQVSPDNRAFVRLFWQDAEGKTVLHSIPYRFHASEERKEARVVIPVQAPDEASRVLVRLAVDRQYDGDLLEINRLEIHSRGE